MTHRYPPRHRAGTELYAARLAGALVARGHAVSVFSAEKDIARPDLSLSERQHEGVRVHELVNNLFHRSFRETFEHAQIEQAFEHVLERERPDLVHVQHLMYLSLGLIEAAKRRALPVVFTLHDYWLECPRFGQLRHADGSLCPVVEPARCGSCLTSFPFGQGALTTQLAKALVGVKQKLGIDLTPLAQRARERLVDSGAQRQAGAIDVERAAQFERDVLARQAAVRARVLERVDRFIAPSAFLERRALGLGIPAAKLVLVPTGIEPQAPTEHVPRERAPSVLFVGTLAEHKGAHVLLDAWSQAALPPGSKLELYGPAGGDAAYVRALSARARELGVALGSALSPAQVRAAMQRAWLLVVPSLWYENAPLVLNEAREAALPVLVSDLGALADLVPEGQGGWRFPCGDATALARELERTLHAPERLRAVLQAAPASPSFARTVDDTLEVYAAVRGGPGAGAAAR